MVAPDAALVGDPVAVPLLEPAPEAPNKKLCVAVAVPAALRVEVCVDVAVVTDVALAEVLSVAMELADKEVPADPVCVPVHVAEGATVGEGEGEGVKVPVGVNVAVGLDEGVAVAGGGTTATTTAAPWLPQSVLPGGPPGTAKKEPLTNDARVSFTQLLPPPPGAPVNAGKPLPLGGPQFPPPPPPPANPPPPPPPPQKREQPAAPFAQPTP